MKIVGHKKQINLLEKILGSEKIPQAYIFSGPEGVGKFFIAKFFADSLNQGLDKIAGKENLDSNNLNVDILSPEEIEKRGVIKIKNIEIKDVRESQKTLSLYPYSGKFRILIINNAHTLNQTSQNALLKTLEEPNRTSIIILVTHKEGNILDTIKSRCQRVNFNLVSLGDIKKGFQERSKEIDLEKVAIFSMGRPGEAEKLIVDDNRIKEKEIFVSDLMDIKDADASRRMDLAERYSKNIPNLIEMLEFWIWFLRIQGYRNLKDNFKMERYYNVIKKIEEAMENLKNPSFNGRLILENLLLEL